MDIHVKFQQLEIDRLEAAGSKVEKAIFTLTKLTENEMPGKIKLCTDEIAKKVDDSTEKILENQIEMYNHGA